MSKALDTLVEFVAATRYEDLPVEVVNRAGLVLMDTVAAILAGSTAPEVQNLASLAVRSSACHSATIFGYRELGDARWTALVNACAGTSTELDEGHAYPKGHPAIHVLPAVIALSEETNQTGRDGLLAFVLGYEVATRVGAACNLRKVAHPHGTWGTLGAATTAAKLMREDVRGIREVIDIASSLTLATSFQSATSGALVRNIYAGMSNQNGLLAWNLYRCGFTGERDGVTNVFGHVMSETFREDVLTDGLGSRFEITRGYFKKHSCCRYNHGALDALDLIRAHYQFEPSDVKQVQVGTYGLAALLSGTQASTTLAARFSIPWAIAISLVRRSTAPAAFDETALTDPQIRGLAERVRVIEDPEYSAMTPARRPARVSVELEDGRTFEQVVYSSRGDREQPFTRDELVSKYFELSAPVIGMANARAALERIQEWPELKDMKILTRLLLPQGG